MDSRIAYLNIRNILSDTSLSTSTIPARGAKQRSPSVDEISRELSIHVARNNMTYDPTHLSIVDRTGRPEYEMGLALKSSISHVTWEFQGIRASFLACATFDGTGDNGTTIGRFAMPGQKLNQLQKALILLTLLDFSIANKQLNANFDFMVHKISADFDGGVSDLRSQLDSITLESKKQAQAILQDSRGELSVAGSV